PWWLAAGRVLGWPAGSFRRSQDAADARVAGDPFEDCLRNRLDPKLLKDTRVRTPVEHTEAQRAVDQNAQPEFGGQGQDASLGIAEPRIVWQLDHVDPTCLHDVAELSEQARQVMRRTKDHDLPLPFQLLEHPKLGLPGDEVVQLVDLDAAEQLQRMSRLGAAFGGAPRPDLGRDHGLRPAAVQRFGEVILGPAVHRRRIEKIHACRQRLIHDASPIFARVKGLPGPHPDDRHVERGPTESAAFQRISAYSTEAQPVLHSTGWLAAQQASFSISRTSIPARSSMLDRWKSPTPTSSPLRVSTIRSRCISIPTPPAAPSTVD